MDGQYIIIVLENPLAFALNFFLLRHQLPRNQGKKKKKKKNPCYTYARGYCGDLFQSHSILDGPLLVCN
ncbi:hypothetical protein I7I48_06033 [Histoplasma ohiense]|nr:hypothetical protein I7I48_06033 [Histoplasma ohiense (nom. inval.)]